ncbi:MAG: exosortase H-associated membrane protein [Candidatus Competibacteraceae bacterium]
MMPRRPIDRFLLHTLLWLVPMFVLWYALAPLLLMPVAGWAHFVLSHLFPHAIAAVEQQGTAVDIVTRFAMAAPADGSAPPGTRGQLVFTINALKYAYGLPMLLALTLAAPMAWGEKLYRAVLGGLLLLPIPVWGWSARRSRPWSSTWTPPSPYRWAPHPDSGVVGAGLSTGISDFAGGVHQF